MLRKVLIGLSALTLIGGSGVYLWGIILYHKTTGRAEILEYINGDLLKEWTFLGFIGGCVAIMTILIIAICIHLFRQERREEMKCGK